MTICVLVRRARGAIRQARNRADGASPAWIARRGMVRSAVLQCGAGVLTIRTGVHHAQVHGRQIISALGVRSCRCEGDRMRRFTTRIARSRLSALPIRDRHSVREDRERGTTTRRPPWLATGGMGTANRTVSEFDLAGCGARKDLAGGSPDGWWIRRARPRRPIGSRPAERRGMSVRPRAGGRQNTIQAAGVFAGFQICDRPSGASSILG